MKLISLLAVLSLFATVSFASDRYSDETVDTSGFTNLKSLDDLRTLQASYGHATGDDRAPYHYTYVVSMGCSHCLSLLDKHYNHLQAFTHSGLVRLTVVDVPNYIGPGPEARKKQAQQNASTASYGLYCATQENGSQGALELVRTLIDTAKRHIKKSGNYGGGEVSWQNWVYADQADAADTPVDVNAGQFIARKAIRSLDIDTEKCSFETFRTRTDSLRGTLRAIPITGTPFGVLEVKKPTNHAIRSLGMRFDLDHLHKENLPLAAGKVGNPAVKNTINAYGPSWVTLHDAATPPFYFFLGTYGSTDHVNTVVGRALKHIPQATEPLHFHIDLVDKKERGVYHRLYIAGWQSQFYRDHYCLGMDKIKGIREDVCTNLSHMVPSAEAVRSLRRDFTSFPQVRD